MPVTLATALDVEILLNQGTVEICIGVPSPPIDAIDPAYKRKEALDKPRKRDHVHLWGKKELAELTFQLLGRHLPSYFEAAGKPAEEMAADLIYAKEVERREKPVKRRQEALDRLRGELSKRAEKLRQEAAERERLAKLAEDEAGQIDAAVANAGGVELFELRARLEEYIQITNKFTTDKSEIRDTVSSKREWIGPADFDKIRELVRTAINGLYNAETLRTVLAELDAICKVAPASLYEPGKQMFVTEAVRFSLGNIQ